MDIRNWLNGPKGLKTKPKPAEIKKKKHALDSSDEDEIDKVKITKPKPKLKQSDVGMDLKYIDFISPITFLKVGLFSNLEKIIVKK